MVNRLNEWEQLGEARRNEDQVPPIECSDAAHGRAEQTVEPASPYLHAQPQERYPGRFSSGRCATPACSQPCADARGYPHSESPTSPGSRPDQRRTGAKRPDQRGTGRKRCRNDGWRAVAPRAALCAPLYPGRNRNGWRQRRALARATHQPSLQKCAARPRECIPPRHKHSESVRTPAGCGLTLVARSLGKKARPAELVPVHFDGNARGAPPGGVLTAANLRAHSPRPKLSDKAAQLGANSARPRCRRKPSSAPRSRQLLPQEAS